MTKKSIGVSQRKLAGRFQCTHLYVNRVIKSVGIHKYNKQIIPDRCDQQKKSIEPSVQRFNVNTEIENRWELFYNDNFYSDNIDFAPDNVKFRRKHKYEKKLLVWIAMSPRGISEPFIMASGNAVVQFVYRDSCLAPRKLPFVKKIILLEITYFDRIRQAVITLNIHWTFYARIWFIMSIRETIPPIC